MSLSVGEGLSEDMESASPDEQLAPMSRVRRLSTGHFAILSTLTQNIGAKPRASAAEISMGVFRARAEGVYNWLRFGSRFNLNFVSYRDYSTSTL